MPVKDAEGNALGALCVVDNRPREMAEHKLESLKALAKLVNAHFELRKTKMQLEESKNELRSAQPVAAAIWHEVQAIVANCQPEKSQQFTQLQEAAGSLNEMFSGQR